MFQPKIKEMVSPSYKKILYGIGQGENHKKLAEIINTNQGVCLFLWLPTHVKTNGSSVVSMLKYYIDNH
jgi:hypothetical protein